jgi:hypothetical protein
MPKIKTFAGACKALGMDAKKLPDVSMLPDDQQDAIIAHYKLVIIAQALNEGWKPNWSDYNEYKYYPWFNMRSGSGFSYHGYVSWLAGTTVGSRLCFKSRELAEYAGEQFIDIYNDFLTIK